MLGTAGGQGMGVLQTLNNFCLQRPYLLAVVQGNGRATEESELGK